MPIYEFKCEACSHIDEHLMKVNDPHPEKCSICGGKVHKIMSQTTFSLKGTGWYVTDYKNAPQNKDGKNASSNGDSKVNENTPVETKANPSRLLQQLHHQELSANKKVRLDKLYPAF